MANKDLGYTRVYAQKNTEGCMEWSGLQNAVTAGGGGWSKASIVWRCTVQKEQE